MLIRHRLSNGIQTIKSHLSKEGSLAHFDRSDHLFDLIALGLTHCMMKASREQETKSRKETCKGIAKRKSSDR